MLNTLENTALAVWIRESTDIYGYTLILSVHALGLAIVVGLSTIIALRLLGFAPALPLATLRRFFPIIYFGFWINACSGVLLFIAEPTKMAAMPAFWGKLALIALGMTVNIAMRRRVFADAQSIEAGVLPATARRFAWVALACWYLALIIGRMTGYPDLFDAIFGTHSIPASRIRG